MSVKTTTKNLAGRKISGEKPEPMYHTKPELAAYMNVSISTVDRQRKTGVLPYYSFRGQIRFVYAEVDAALVKNCRISGRPKLAH
jgi:excisionase family DNA binding protein